MTARYGTYSSDRLEDVPSTKVAPDVLGGRLRVCYDIYTLTADIAASDTINMGKLPKGARVVGGWLKTDDLDASGGTADLGWAASAELDSSGSAVEAADDNGFLNDVDVTTTGGTTTDLLSQANMPGLGKKFAAAVEVQVKIEGDTDATSGEIESCLYYVID